MFSFISKPSSQVTINKIASIAIIVFTMSLLLSNAIMNISFVILLLLYLFGGNYQEKIQQIKSSPASIFFLLFFAWTVFAVAYSKASPNYIEYDLLKYKKILLLPIFIYFLNGRNLNTYIYALLAGTALMILYTFIFDQHGLILSIKAHQFMYSGNPIRNYITEGVYLTTSLFATLWFIKNKIHRSWMFLLLILIIIQIAFNNGRMALISIAFSLLLLINFSIQNKRTKILLVLGAVVLAYATYLFSPLIHMRVDRTIEEASQIVNFANAESIRLQYWYMSWEKFITNPIIGFGPGSFKQMIIDSDKPGEFSIHWHAHNEYLFVMLQYGLIGFSLLLAAFFSTLKNFKLNATSPARLIAFTGILIMLLNCFTDCHLYNMNEGNFFILLIAIYLSRDQSNLQQVNGYIL